MDYFKKGTAKNWFYWGLDVKEVGILYTHSGCRRKLCKQFKRSARRQDKCVVRNSANWGEL